MDSTQAPRAQLAEICPLANELYDYTRKSASLVNQAANELGLLISVLSCTRTHCSSQDATSTSSDLSSALDRCLHVLRDLQQAQQRPGVVGSQHQITDIRARLSSLISELSVMNANIGMSSQSSQDSVNKATRRFIDDIHMGKRDASIVSRVLDTTCTLSLTEKDEAWRVLQNGFEELGISPESSTQDRDFIHTALEKAVREEGLLRSTKRNSWATGLSGRSQHGPSVPRALSDKDRIALLRASSRDNLPIPVAFDRQGTLYSDKIALPRGTSDNFPIPVTSERRIQDADKHILPREDFPIPVLSATYLPGGDTNKEVLLPDIPESLPIPLATEPSSTDSRTLESRSDGSSSTGNTSVSGMKHLKGKRPSIMRKMKYKLTTSKEEFIALIQGGGLFPVKHALDKGAEVDTMDLKGKTALMVAVSSGHEHIVNLLLEYGATTTRQSTVGETALSIAALKGYEGIVRLLLIHGAPVDQSKDTGKTALSQAAEGGHENIVRLLFNAGADINGICHTGDTALSQAAQNGHVDIVRYLLDNGALVDHTAYPRRTALYKAVENGKLEVVKVLLQRGADPLHPESIQGWTPTFLASMQGNSEISDLLNKHGNAVLYRQQH